MNQNFYKQIQVAALKIYCFLSLRLGKYNWDFHWLMHLPSFSKFYLGASSSTPINLFIQIAILNFIFLPIGYFHKFRTHKILYAIFLIINFIFLDLSISSYNFYTKIRHCMFLHPARYL